MIMKLINLGESADVPWMVSHTAVVATDRVGLHSPAHRDSSTYQPC